MYYKEIQFTHPSSARLYKRYMLEAKGLVEQLPNEQRFDILCEINSHIFEGLCYQFPNNRPTESDSIQLKFILDQLGSPHIFIAEMSAMAPVAPVKTYPSVREYAYKLISKLLQGLISIVYYSIYTLILLATFLILAKFVDPHGVGFFYSPNKFFIFGKLILQQEEATKYEQFGHYFIPIFLVIISILYYSSTLVSKLKKLTQHKY